MSLVIGDSPQPQHEHDAEDITAANLSDEEGDALFPKQHLNAKPVRPLKLKQTNAVCNLALLLCPYLFALIFIIFFFLFHHTVLSAPMVSVFNAFPGQDSLWLNLSKTFDSMGNISISNPEECQYNFSSYLFKIAPFNIPSCGAAKFYLCDASLQYSSVRSYSIHSSEFPCVAFLTRVEDQPSTELKHLTKLSNGSLMEAYRYREISYSYGLVYPLNHIVYQPCEFTATDSENSFPQNVPTTELYLANQSVNVSLPHYEFDPVACQEASLPFSIGPLSHKNVLITNVTSFCQLVISWHLKFPWSLSAVFFIFLFLVGCDISHCAYRRCFKKKYE